MNEFFCFTAAAVSIDFKPRQTKKNQNQANKYRKTVFSTDENNPGAFL